MAVMEAIMNLFVKEVASAERIVSAVRRFSDPTDPLVATSLQQTPKDAEQALLLWISMSCQALKKRLAAEAEANVRHKLFSYFDFVMFLKMHQFHLGFFCRGRACRISLNCVSYRTSETVSICSASSPSTAQSWWIGRVSPATSPSRWLTASIT